MKEYRLKRSKLFTEVIIVDAVLVALIGVCIFVLKIYLVTEGLALVTLIIIVTVLLFIKSQLPMIALKISINDEMLIIRELREELKIRFEDITLFDLSVNSNNTYLFIADRVTSKRLNVTNMDIRGFEEHMTGLLNRTVFDVKKYRRENQEYRQYVKTQKAFKKQQDFYLSINDGNASLIIGFMIFLIFSLSFIYCALKAEIVFSLVFFILSLFGIALIMVYGKTIVTKDYIYRENKFIKRKILWNEIIWIEADTNGQAIGFFSANKRLVIPGPYFWEEQKKEDIDKINMLIADREIKSRVNDKVFYLKSKNVGIINNKK